MRLPIQNCMPWNCATTWDVLNQFVLKAYSASFLQYSVTCLVRPLPWDHLSWKTTHIWQKDLHFNITELSPETTCLDRAHFLWPMGWSFKTGSTVQWSFPILMATLYSLSNHPDVAKTSTAILTLSFSSASQHRPVLLKCDQFLSKCDGL